MVDFDSCGFLLMNTNQYIRSHTQKIIKISCNTRGSMLYLIMRDLKRNTVDKSGLAVRNTSPTILTLGHSNRTQDQFLAKLAEYRVECVVDVRTRPASRWSPWFNRRNLESILPTHSISYLFRGYCLGGLAENIGYDEAISEVAELAQTTRLVLLCSEADYAKCHRYSMLTPDLEKRNVKVEHILWDTSKPKQEKLYG